MTTALRLYYLAPFCFGLEESLANAFEAQGLEVQRRIYAVHKTDKQGFLEGLYNHYGLVKRIKLALDRMGLLEGILRRSLNRLNETVLKEAAAYRPHLIFIVKGEILYPETLQRLKAIAPLISYHWDDPFLRYAQQMDETRDTRYRNLAQSYSFYDATFVYDESYIEPLRKAGAKDAIYLMDWYEPEIYKPLTLSDEDRANWGADVAFVGSPYPNRIALLEALSEFNVGVWGPYFRWKEHFSKYPFLQKAYRGEAQGADSVKIYNASKISLNIHDTFQCATSVNNRTFQILASGGFQLVDDRARLHQLFEVGSDLVVFSTPSEAIDKVSYFLGNPVERTKIRQRGRTKAAQHSSTQRARFILDHVKSNVLKTKGEHAIR